MIVDRDVDVLRFLNLWVFARTSRIAEIFFSGDSLDGKKVRARRRLQRMENEGLLKSQKEFTSGEKVFWLTHSGKTYLSKRGHEAFKVTRDFKFQTFIHDDMCLAVLEILLKRGFQLSDVKSERELRRLKFFSLSKYPQGREVVEYITPDLVLKSGSELIAFEIEISRKSVARIEKKFADYHDWSEKNPKAQLKIVYVVPEVGDRERLKNIFNKLKNYADSHKRLPLNEKRFRFLTIEDFQKMKAKRMETQNA